MNKKESDITTDFVLKVKMLKQEDKRIILALLTGMELQSSLDKIEKNNKTVDQLRSIHLVCSSGLRG